MKTVVTYQTPEGKTIRLCSKCAEELKQDWPKDSKGREFCSVSHGAHRDICDRCDVSPNQHRRRND